MFTAPLAGDLVSHPGAQDWLTARRRSVGTETSLICCHRLGFSRARLSCPWWSHSRRYWNISEFSGVNQNTPPYLLRPISLRFVPRARAGPWFIRHKSFLMSHRLLGWGGWSGCVLSAPLSPEHLLVPPHPFTLSFLLVVSKPFRGGEWMRYPGSSSPFS